MKIAVLDTKGKKIKDVDLKNEVFNQKFNEPLVHQVVTAEMAKRRGGTAATKTRAMVAGGGAKPWRQKGTGRARAGSIRSPLWRGGGVVFGPQPRSYTTRIPRKMRKEAIKSALSAKVQNSEIIILDKLDIKKAKTKQAIQIIEGLKLQGRTTILIPEASEIVEKSFRNLPNVKVLHLGEITTYDVLDNKNLVMTNEAVNKLMEILV